MKDQKTMFILVAVSVFVLTYLVFEKASCKLLIITSNSMRPALCPADLVIVLPVQKSQIKKGDIIAYRAQKNGGPIVVHRVIKVTEGMKDDGNNYVLKGDQNKHPDPQPVNSHMIIGKARLSLPFLGLLAYFIKKPVGYAVLIVLPFIWLMLDVLEVSFRKSGARKKT